MKLLKKKTIFLLLLSLLWAAWIANIELICVQKGDIQKLIIIQSPFLISRFDFNERNHWKGNLGITGNSNISMRFVSFTIWLIENINKHIIVNMSSHHEMEYNVQQFDQKSMKDTCFFKITNIYAMKIVDPAFKNESCMQLVLQSLKFIDWISHEFEIVCQFVCQSRRILNSFNRIFSVLLWNTFFSQSKHSECSIYC